MANSKWLKVALKLNSSVFIFQFCKDMYVPYSMYVYRLYYVLRISVTNRRKGGKNFESHFSRYTFLSPTSSLHCVFLQVESYGIILIQSIYFSPPQFATLLAWHLKSVHLLFLILSCQNLAFSGPYLTYTLELKLKSMKVS